MQQRTLNKKGNESPSFLDPQITMRANIMLLRKEVVAYFVKVMSHYNDKDMLVVPFNMVTIGYFYQFLPSMIRSGTVTLPGQ
jgi:hypothetical protein